MSDQTLGLITAIKTTNQSKWRDMVIHVMMHYTGSPRSAFTDLQIYRIMENTFLDYLSTADRPDATVGVFLMSLENKPMLSLDSHMATALAGVKTKNESGEYINGFRPLPDYIREPIY